MTFPGLGHSDWVELDLDAFDLDRHASVLDRLEQHRERIESLVASSFEIEPSRNGSAEVIVDGCSRFHAEMNPAGRLVLTSIPDPEGPL